MEVPGQEVAFGILGAVSGRGFGSESLWHLKLDVDLSCCE